MFHRKFAYTQQERRHTVVKHDSECMKCRVYTNAIHCVASDQMLTTNSCSRTKNVPRVRPRCATCKRRPPYKTMIMRALKQMSMKQPERKRFGIVAIQRHVHMTWFSTQRQVISVETFRKRFKEALYSLRNDHIIAIRKQSVQIQ